MAEIRPNLERIKQLTAQNLANKNAANQQNYISSPKPTVSFNPQAPDTITPMDANLPTTPTKIEPTAPTGTFDPFATKTVDTSTPEGMLEAGAIDKRGAVNELIKKFSTTATESSYDMYKRMREEEGLGKLIEGRNDVFKTVQTTMDAIDQLEETIAREGAEIGTLTKAQLGNITGREGKELTRRLNTANNLLQSYNLSIGDVESKIDKFMQFDRQDKADELERLVNLANYAGLTQDEKDILAFEIDKKLKADEKEEASLEQKQDTLDSGITALREMATGAGVITGKFAEVAAEAQRRLDAGEDPQAILADVSAAVLNNPTLQRQFEIERIKAEQSIVARSSGGGGGGGSEDENNITVTNAQRQTLLANGLTEDAQVTNFADLSRDAKILLSFSNTEIKDNVKTFEEGFDKDLSTYILPDIGKDNKVTQEDFDLTKLNFQQSYPTIPTKEIDRILDEKGFKVGTKVKEEWWGKDLKI